jgi:hypothetical protein
MRTLLASATIALALLWGGFASQGHHFRVLVRKGEWVHVEGESTKGWINGRYLSASVS